MTFFQIRTIFAAIALTAAALSVAPALALDAQEKEEIGAFIREYLVENPEVLLEAQQAYEAKQQAALAAQASETIARQSEAIFNTPTDMVLGNPDGDVTIVEFFDYNCGYCKRAHADMQALIESDPNLRFVLKEWPVLGPDSLAAHQVSMAFRKIAPEQYGTFQDALMTAEGGADEASAVAIALSLGVDEAELRAAMADPAINAEISDVYVLADALGISGTPSYIVGDEAVYGAHGAEVLSEKIANVRACDSATC